MGLYPDTVVFALYSKFSNILVLGNRPFHCLLKSSFFQILFIYSFIYFSITLNLFVFLLETGVSVISQGGLKILGSGSLPTSASQVVATRAVGHVLCLCREEHLKSRTQFCLWQSYKADAISDGFDMHTRYRY